jgi:hypothetical protein
MVGFCKTRKERKTLYAFGEGETEKAFLRHLKTLYSGDNIKISVKDLAGGCPNDMIDKAVRIILHGSYDEKFIVLDEEKDKGILISEWAKNKAKKHGLDIIDLQPCVEGLFLLILGKEKSSILAMHADQCKKEFENNYLDAQKKLNFTEYQNILPKELLEEKRGSISELDRIINYMENKE